MFALPCSTISCASASTFSLQISSASISDILQSTAAICMDANRSSWTGGVHRKPRIPKTPDSSLQPTGRSGSERRPQQFSSPLPQTEWAKPEQRPRSHIDTQPRRQSSYTNRAVPNFSRHVTPPRSAVMDWETEEPLDSGRYQQDFQSSQRAGDGTRQASMDVALLYPHISQDRRSTYSAPDEMEYSPPRSYEDQSAFGNMTAPYLDEATPANVHRNATYPPATTSAIRRIRSTSTIPDATFADEEEFTLFAQATSGLGLDGPFSGPFSSSPPTRSSPSRNLRPPPPTAAAPPRSSSSSHRSRTDHTTPVITQAIRQLEQLLGDDCCVSGSSSQQQQQQRSRSAAPASTSAHDLRAQALEAAAFEAEMARWEGDYDDRSDDELPDYAQSQAQAQAHQRIEAARRAQELQRRWQLSGSRRPN